MDSIAKRLVVKQPANGTRGCLLPSYGGDSLVFRVYCDDHSFIDYDVRHSDLQVVIDDPDSYFYEDAYGVACLDHSPATLGLTGVASHD